MADENVDIKIKFDAHVGQLNRAIAKLAVLERQVKSLSSGREEAFAKRTARGLGDSTSKWRRHFDFIDAGAKMAGKSLSKFLGLAIKGVLIEMAALGASMIAIHALFVSGQFLVKAYRGAMHMLAAGAAGAAVAIATASAAIREQQAAIFAYRGKGSPAFGSAMNQTRMGMRNLQMDADLATLGVEALNKAYGNMSKTMSVTQINQSKGSLKALMDFGSAGQDPAKGLEQVSVVMQTLADKKKGIGNVLTEAKKLGPEMQKALKSANIKTKKQFEDLLMSGELAKKGGVLGQFDAVNSTLLSQLKGYFTRLRGEFADFGDQFLEPVKVAFEKVFNVIRRDMQRVLGAVMFSFGTQGVIDNFSSAIEKASNWLVKMIRNYLPGAIGMFGKISDWYDRFRRGWNLVLDQTRPLTEGAKVLYAAWSPIWEAIKRGATNLTLFRDLLVGNKNDMIEFGDRIANLIDTLSKFFQNLKKMFMDMLPFINDMLAGLTDVIGLLTRTLTMFAGGGFMSAFAPLVGAGILARGMAGVKGRMMPNVSMMSAQTMNVNSGVVNIAGPVGPVPPGTIARTATQAGGAGTQPSLSSGALPTAAAHAPVTAAELAKTGQSFKTSGGNAGGPSKQFYSQIASDPRSRFFSSIKAGADNQTRNSFRGLRAMAINDARSQIGPGITNTLFSRLGQANNPYAPPGNAGVAASQTFGQGIRNSFQRMKLSTVSAADTAQYGARRAIGGIRGGLAALSAPAWDAENNKYYDVGEMRNQVNERLVERYGEGKGGFGARVLRAREMNRINRNYSKFGNAYNNKFAKSISGRMGASMGLGMLSQIAPEEMRGAMALGGTFAQIDPRLGLAVAGIGGAMKAQGGFKGAISGAAGGAALGGMFGPQGAAIGAGIGLVVGGIMGAVNKGAAQLKAAKDAVSAQFTNLYRGIASSAANQLEQNKLAIEQGRSIAGAPAAFSNYGRKMSAIGLRTTQDINASMIKVGATINEKGNYALTPDQARQALELYSKTQSGVGLTQDQLKAMKGKKPGFWGGFKRLISFGKYGQDNVPVTSINAIQQRGSAERLANYKKIDQVNNKRIAELSKATGKSSAELEILAQSMGVDLYDATVDYDTLLGKFTQNLRKNKAQLNAALTDVFLAGANPFKKNREAQESQNALNQNFRQISDILRGGGSEAKKMGAVNTGMEQAFSQILAVAGGDAFKAYEIFNTMFRSGEGKGIFAPNAEFAGLDKYFRNNPLFQTAASSIDEGVSKEAGAQIRGILSDKGMTIDSAKLEGLINSMSPQEKEKFLQQLSVYGERPAAGANAKGFQLTPLEKALNSENPAKALASIFPQLAGLTIGTTDKGAMNELVNASGDMAEALKDFNELVKGFFTGPSGGPDWWNKGLVFDGKTLKPPADTSTPRAGQVGDTSTSKLSQTMARHAAMDGQLTGTRTVTSSLRNYALGSPSSDHANGSAYDLVGQNLGQYARLVHANGGFAEFHGSAATRHLHVVPGPGIGDTSSVRPMSKVSTNSGGVTNYYSFEINGANASPEAIANMVIAKIDSRDRSNRERR